MGTHLHNVEPQGTSRGLDAKYTEKYLSFFLSLIRRNCATETRPRCTCQQNYL